MPADTLVATPDPEPRTGPVLPGWVYVLQSGGGIRLAGYAREIEVAGAKFVELCADVPRVSFATPPPERLLLINAAQIKTITPTTAQKARAAIPGQWPGRRFR